MSVGCPPTLGGELYLTAEGGGCGGGCNPQSGDDYPGYLTPMGSQEPLCSPPPGRCECADGGGGGLGWPDAPAGWNTLGYGGGSPGEVRFMGGDMTGIGLNMRLGGGGTGTQGDDPRWLNTASGSDRALCHGPVGPGGCLHPDTWVELFPTGRKRAGDIAPGDVLRSLTDQFDPVGEEVTAVRVSDQPRLRIGLANGACLHCSTTHELLVEDPAQEQGRTMAAGRLGLDSRLFLADRRTVEVVAIVREEAGPVVQIGLAGPSHAYLAGGVWSHNFMKDRIVDG